MFAALVSSVQMILTSVESAAKRYNKKVTKITVAAVADIVTDIIFLHMVRKSLTCLIIISSCLIDPFQMRQRMEEPFSICNHRMLHRKIGQTYQCLSCKEEFEVDIEIPPFNQEGNIITE